MTLASLNRAPLACLGLGSENCAMLAYLFKHGLHTPVTVFDVRDFSALARQYPAIRRWKDVSWQTDKPGVKNLHPFSLVFRSPGVFLSPSLRQQLKKQGTSLTCPMQLFMELCPSRRIIGVTGTKGKGTTASLIEAILKRAGKRVWLGGNIGVGPFAFFDRIKKSDWVILELSSFQLEDMNDSPPFAILTNFFPEHLAPADPTNPNHHVSLGAYWRAKCRIFQFQKPGGLIIANRALAGRLNRRKHPNPVVYTGASSLPSRLIGAHNAENIALAEATARHLTIKPAVIARAIRNFKGLEHRLEYVGKKHGVAYYNDSFATTPEAAVTALESFPPGIILLAGGADKGSNFSVLARCIKKTAEAVILFKGKGGKRLATALRRVNYPPGNIIMATSMTQALKSARTLARPGDIVLLSPACASFGVFKNYKDRGEQFKQAARTADSSRTKIRN